MVNAREKVTRISTEERKAREWALVLESAGIPYQLSEHAAHWLLVVPSSDEVPALAALDAYDRENPGQPAAAAVAPEYGRSYAGVVMAGSLLAFYGVTSWGGGATAWMRQGNASALHILEGEVWRTATALTLHASVAHVASNAVACALFATGVCRALGPGVGLWLMLLAGAGGNALNAILRGPPHGAVGASTAVFGAVGALGALQFMARYRFGAARRAAWVPVAAALALLAMLGTGAQTDVLAHLFGMLTGGFLGVAASRIPPHTPGRVPQFALVLAAVATLAAAWAVALR
jgi:membrane associated rhomboid family serine protease